MVESESEVIIGGERKAAEIREDRRRKKGRNKRGVENKRRAIAESQLAQERRKFVYFLGKV